MEIVSISGHAGSGKDTVAGIIKERLEHDDHKVLITHYADLLKYICKTFFNWNGKKDERGREILQYVGTDIIRKQDENYWVDFLISIFRFFDKHWDYVLIPDLRFENEYTRLKDSGFDAIHLRIVRPDFQSLLTDKQQKHVSETSLDSVKPDYTIVNSGSLDDLKTIVNNWITEELYG